MKKNRIVYCAPQKSSFVAKDLEILSKSFDVKYFEFSGKGKWRFFRNLLRQVGFLLRQSFNAKAVVVMFGGNHSLLPAIWAKVFGKKCYVILGGTDCVSFPSIDYGTFRSKLQGRMACATYRLASRLLPVHESLMYRKETYYTQDSTEQGCQHWCKGLKTEYTAVYNGYDPDKWVIDRTRKNPRHFITVAAITDLQKLKLKGIDLILEVASSFEDCLFTVVGVQCDLASLEIPPNVELIPFLSHSEMKGYFESARFYLQLSISEGFPNALCESMLAQCIPICSRVAAMPQIVGETGFLLDHRDPELFKGLLRRVLEVPDGVAETTGMAARVRISENYSIGRRESGFLSAILGERQ